MSTTATPNQKRYRDWRAPVTSKDSMEPFSILTGLGPKYGFDRFSQIAIYGDSVNLTIGHLNQSQGTSAIQHKGLTNADQSVYVLGGVVISPDGIITTVNEDLPFSWNKATNTVFTESGASFIEVVLVATHNYIEDEVGLAHSTNFRLILNTNALSIKGAVGFKDYVNGGTKRLSDWLSHPVIDGNIDTTNEVIVGLYRINLTTPANSELAVIYDYNWPNLKVPTYLDWVNINNLVTELDNETVRATGNQVISGTKSFTTSPIIPDADENNEAASLGQVKTMLHILHVGSYNLGDVNPNPTTKTITFPNVGTVDYIVMVNIKSNRSPINDSDMIYSWGTGVYTETSFNIKMYDVSNGDVQNLSIEYMIIKL